MSPIGFIILTHRNPAQIERLVRTLNRIFDDPPIVCHHDFSKCALDEGLFTQNVQFVRPHFVTGWAAFSVVEATVVALERMFSRWDAPRIACVISGADYPIKPADIVLRDLEAGSYDAHIFHVPITFSGLWRHAWTRKCFFRYRTSVFDMPSLDKKFQRRRRKLSLWLPLYTAMNAPFSSQLRCHAGRQWFNVNRRAAEVIVEFHRERPVLARHYRNILFSEESYFQTILASQPNLRLSKEDWRFVRFSGRNSHPDTLQTSDFGEIAGSKAHFARKFDPDGDIGILDTIDDFVATTSRATQG